MIQALLAGLRICVFNSIRDPAPTEAKVTMLETIWIRWKFVGKPDPALIPKPLHLSSVFRIRYQRIGSSVFNKIKGHRIACMITVLRGLAIVVLQNNSSQLDKSTPEVHWSSKQEQIGLNTAQIEPKLNVINWEKINVLVKEAFVNRPYFELENKRFFCWYFG